MLKIRLQRVGRKHEPAFRLVLTDSKNSTKSGRFLEVLGSHDFRFDTNTKVLKERVLYWLSKGAKASNTVHNLLISEKIIEGKKINVLPKYVAPVKKEEEAPKVEVKEETPASEAAPVEAKEETPAPAEEVAEVKNQ